MNPKSTLALTKQTVCIDLPGETVSCWRSTDKVQVILRKHRDVIFDLKLTSDRKYTVESTGSDFYHADKKKLIAGKGRQRVLFNDGERLHLWISREFKGELLLKLEGKVLIRVDPAKLDETKYDELPASKPDPIVVSIGESRQAPAENRKSTLLKLDKLELSSRQSQHRLNSAPIDEDCPLVCVIETNLKGAPAAVVKAIENDGGNSGLVDVDPFDVATRNWITGQLTGAAAYVVDNWGWLRESLDGRTHQGFKLVSAKIHYVRGQARFYFSGYSKHNKIFGPGGFGSGHKHIMTIFGGVGKVGTVLKSTAKGILGTFKNCALVSFIFNSGVSFLEWKADASKDGYDLFATLMMNAIKAVVVAAIVAPLVAAIMALIIFGAEASVVVVAVGALCLGLGTIASFGVEAADKKLGKVIGGEENNGGLSEILAKRIRQNVQGNWDYLRKKLLWEYEEIPF